MAASEGTASPPSVGRLREAPYSTMTMEGITVTLLFEMLDELKGINSKLGNQQANSARAARPAAKRGTKA